MKFQYKLVRAIPEIIDAVRLRIKVFFEEQRVSPLEDIDKYDKGAYHFIAEYNKEIIGVCRARILNKKAKIERIAVDKNFRNKGAGAGLTKFAITFLKKRGIKNIYLHAQYYAKGFYEKSGFKVVGKPFIEQNTKHIKMVLKNENLH